ncbi:MAG: DUF924 family protein [Bdellovibrionales bacterium]
MNSDEILKFWFEELTPKQWFAKDTLLDRTIEKRFGALHHKAALGEMHIWRASPKGRLAEILVLDQFSRNLFRDQAKAFAQDGMALVLAQEAVARGFDAELPLVQRKFVYMPYMHSESPAIHEIAVKLFSIAGLEDNLKFEMMHKKIIDRFGRYPHRNAVLGRESTPEEIEFLKQPGSGF